MGNAYNASSHAQYDAHRISYPQLDTAVEALCACENRQSLTHWRVTDLGSAGGRNSIRTCIRTKNLFNKHGAGEVPISLTLSDLPTSNFNDLISTVDELLPALNKDDSKAQVYVEVLGRSFYEKLFPPSSVHLSTSFIALHWINGIPAGGARALGNLTKIHEPGVPNEGLALWRSHALESLRTFLEARSDELACGGQGVYMATGGLGTSDRVASSFEEPPTKVRSCKSCRTNPVSV